MKRKILSIILLNVTVFFALISIHEITHLGAGYLMGCEQGKAVLLNSMLEGPYTEMICANGMNQTLFYLSGLLMTSCFGLLFLSMKTPGRNMFMVVFGLSFIFSALDMGLASLGIAAYPMMLFGFSSITAGEYYMASSYMKSNVQFDIFGLE
ncbi:MAG: hypothetical protein JW700_01100 [Candidatus Aenigmarchaeota archaeon]|nr:hypothetical protein [Candidatus Aenigmarchaeota archaeon]